MFVTLAALVVSHLAVAISHGSAHFAAGVNVSPVAMAFIVAVILVAPPAGLLWMLVNRRLGARAIAFSLAGALLFGLVNHFVIPGADRVDHVAAAWRGWFGTTATLLAVTESAGALLAVAYERRTARRIV